MLQRIASLLAMTLLLSACAIGNQYDYKAAQLTIDSKTEKSVSAAVVDQRGYVVSGDKTPDFVGLQRGGFGNPFDVTTQSGRGLAEDLTENLQRGLESRGVASEALMLPAGASLPDSLSQFRDQGTDRLLLVNMNEWKTDAMMRMTLHWNLEAKVYDPAGQLLGEHRILGVDAVGSAGLESGNSNAAKQQVSLKMAELLNNEAIVEALQ